MSEDGVTTAIWNLFDHPALVHPAIVALVSSPKPKRPASVTKFLRDSAAGAWTSKTGSGRPGADLIVTDNDDRLLLMVENKLANGPAQWTRVSHCDAGAVADGDAAVAFSDRLVEALGSPELMPLGSEPHTFPCKCKWSDGWHSKVRTGIYECGNPQLDYYAYYRNWSRHG